MLMMGQPVMEQSFHTPFHSQAAFTLIEILCVLAIFAVILMMGVKRFQQYREKMQTVSVQSDIKQIEMALDQYFYATGCDVSGRFPPEKQHPSLADLGITTFDARLPLVVGYSVQVVDSGQKTIDQRPIYVLQMTAALNSTVSLQQINWYKQLFNAERVDKNNLIWQTMPNNSVTNSLNPYWVLDGQRAVFRKIQNGLQTTQYRYCAQ